jgi:hypothetical protein
MVDAGVLRNHRRGCTGAVLGAPWLGTEVAPWRRTMLAWLLATTLAWSIPPGRVVPPPPTPPPVVHSGEQPTRWYGGPSVVVDILSFTMIGGGSAASSPEFLLLGAAGFAFGSPINHLAQGHPGRAAGSFGLRVLGAGLATGVVLLDVASHPCDGEPSCHHSPGLGWAGAALVLITTMVIDDAVLARAPALHSPRPARAVVAPGVVVGPNLALASLAGSF